MNIEAIGKRTLVEKPKDLRRNGYRMKMAMSVEDRYHEFPTYRLALE